MRHETIQQSHELDALDIAAVWPSTTQVAPLPVSHLNPLDAHSRISAEAAPDMPVAVGVFLMIVYGALLATLAFGIAGDGRSLFAIGVDVVFMVMFFAVPAVFLGLSNAGRAHPSLARFMDEGIQTLNGHSTGSAALVQMLIVPASLTIGVICMGITAAVVF